MSETRAEKDRQDVTAEEAAAERARVYALDFWTERTHHERLTWGAGYDQAERDYCVRDLPTLLELAELTEDRTHEEHAAIERLRAVVAKYNDEGTL